MKKRILIVDEDKKTLNDAESLLQDKLEEWDITFAVSGPDALVMLDENTFDVIVTDLCMNQMSGMQLLTLVQKAYPMTIRLMLDDRSELDETIKSIKLAHQSIAKPIDASFVKTLQTALNIQSIINNKTVSEIVGDIEKLPSLPNIYQEISMAMQRPNVSSDKIASIIEKDLALTTKILQLVNSSFFGLGQKITSVSKAVGLIGLSMLKILTLLTESLASFNMGQIPKAFSIERLQNDAILYGKVASKVFQKVDRDRIEDAFMAGFLHGIGYLIMIEHLNEGFAQALHRHKEEQRSLIDCENEICSTNHAEIGAYLLGLWGLPLPIIEAVAYYYAPQNLEHTGFDLVDAVHIASQLSQEARHEISEEDLDMDYYEELGVAEHIPEWRQLVADLLSGAER